MLPLRYTTSRLLMTSLFVLALALSGHAAVVKGVQFADQVAVNGAELRITGVAVLKWAMLFDVYAGGLYLPEGNAGREWRLDVPKKLELSYFRKIAAQGFAEASDKLLRENLAPEEYKNLSERLTTFYSFFEDVKPGDRYSITYAPGKGTELRLNDKAMGSVAGHDFAVAYFGIWLGEKPINKTFRDRLLGTR